MIRFSVDVYRHIIWFSIWSISACMKVHFDVGEVNNLKVGLYCFV